ncbi:MAG: glycosyltransferase family 4 protein [Candidatus Hydrogenedentes bacterium]|nr:glycosyltransferase family 4 protein [Candidatus Hydrogenedentota bacterium]
MTWRVAMVAACPYPAPQGSQVLLRDTARALHEAGHTVHLVVYGHGVREAADDFPVHRCPSVPGYRKTSAGPSLGKPLADAFLVGALRRVVREEDIEVIHAHNYEGLLVALAARVRPVVYHAHNAMADELPWYFSGNRGARRFGAWLDRTFPKRADRIIVPHQALAEYLISRGCNAEKVSVIPPTCAAHDFAEPEYHDGPAEVLYTGNLDLYQNLALLEKAMDIVTATEPEARFVVATAAEGAGRLRNAEVLHTADINALREVLARDAIVVCPRVAWSGYPIKILNAMAAGRPVIACRSAAGPITDGIDGVTIPDNDAQAFAEAILRLRHDPELREYLGTAARETIRTLHKPALLARRLERVYAAACKT